MLNTIKAVMLSGAVGDALGVPVEFGTREELDGAPVEDMEGFGSYPILRVPGLMIRVCLFARWTAWQKVGWTGKK